MFVKIGGERRRRGPNTREPCVRQSSHRGYTFSRASADLDWWKNSSSRISFSLISFFPLCSLLIKLLFHIALILSMLLPLLFLPVRSFKSLLCLGSESARKRFFYISQWRRKVVKHTNIFFSAYSSFFLSCTHSRQTSHCRKFH